MKHAISNFLSRFTSFINSERGIASVAVVSTASALTAATAMVANVHKNIANESLDTAMQLAPGITSALSDITSSQILEIANVNAAVAATTMLVAAGAMLLKKPAENLSRTFGENSIIGVNAKVKGLIKEGKQEEAQQFITEAFERSHHGKHYLVRQYLDMEKKNPSAVNDIKQALNLDNNHKAELSNTNAFTRT